MLILCHSIYTITYTLHVQLQLHFTSQSRQSSKGSHLALFFPILAKTSISSILHGTDGRQLNTEEQLQYISTLELQSVLAASQEESELFAPKELYEQPRPAPSTTKTSTALQLHTKTCIICMYFLPYSLRFYVKPHGLFMFSRVVLVFTNRAVKLNFSWV